MESSEDDAGTATSASRLVLAREKDIEEAESSNASNCMLQQPSEARALCRTPAMSEENFDGDSVPSPSAHDVNTSTEAILDMIDEFVDGPGAPKRVISDAINKPAVSEIEKIDKCVIAQESPKTVPVEEPPPSTFSVLAPSAKNETEPNISAISGQSAPSEVSIAVIENCIKPSQDCSVASVCDPSVDNEVSNVSAPFCVDSHVDPPSNIPSSSVLETSENLPVKNVCESQDRTVKCVTSSDTCKDVTIESAESTSSDSNLSGDRTCVEQSTRSPLRRRLVRPGPSERRPDSTVSSTVDIHTEQSHTDGPTKAVSSSSDVVGSVHGSVTPDEVSVNEISICKAETSISPTKKIKLIRQKFSSPASTSHSGHDKQSSILEQDQCSASHSGHDKQSSILEQDQCQSTSSETSTLHENESNLSSISSSELTVTKVEVEAQNTKAYSDSSTLVSNSESKSAEKKNSNLSHQESTVEHQNKTGSETLQHEGVEESPLQLKSTETEELIENTVDVKEQQSSSKYDCNTEKESTSFKCVPKITIKIGNKPSEGIKSPVPKLTIKPIKPPEDKTVSEAEQIPNVTKLNIKPVLRPSEKSNVISTDSLSATKLLDGELIPNVAKINIKHIPKPPEKINDIHRKSSSSEVSESEYSENDESTSTSDQGISDVVPKVTIKQSEGKFYTESQNIPKLTIKGLQHSENEESESKLKLIISQTEEKHSEKVPKLTIKTVTKSEGQPLSPKLTIKTFKSEENYVESSDAQQFTKLKISTECYKSCVDVKDSVHVPKITIKPVTKTEVDSKSNKRLGTTCESSDYIPLVTKLNIKPIIKPTETGESCEILEDKVPAVSKLNIKPIIKPKHNELETSIEDIPKVTKLNIKPLQKPKDDSSEEKDCDELNADIEVNRIPIISKINIKPIVKPEEEDVSKDSENQSSETGNSSDDNTDHIPVVTRINIKPIIKPTELEDKQKHKNDSGSPIVPKLNIKPIVKPEETKSPASPKKDPVKHFDTKNASIPIVTKLNIKPLVKPVEPELYNDVDVKLVKNPPLVMKINMKAVSETPSGLINNENVKENNIDVHNVHVHNNVGEEILETAQTLKNSCKLEVEQMSEQRILEKPNCSRSDNKGETVFINEVIEQKHMAEDMKVNCITDTSSGSEVVTLEQQNVSKEVNIPTCAESSLSSESSITKTDLLTTNMNAVLHNKKPLDTSNTELCNKVESESSSTTEVLTHSVEAKTLNAINKEHVTSVKNCTLLKKLLETNESFSEKTKSQSSINISDSTISNKISDSEPLSMEKVCDIATKESKSINKRSPSPEKTNDFQPMKEARSIHDVYSESNDNVTKPLEIHVSDKLTQQSSGQDSPRIILKINKTDHGPSAKIITEDIKSDSSQPTRETESTVQNAIDKPGPKRKFINSRRKQMVSPSVTVGKRLRSSRIVESSEKQEKTSTSKKVLGKRSLTVDSTATQTKETDLSVLEAKRLKLGQLLSNTSLTIKPVISKTTLDNSPLENKQGTRILNHNLVNNENCAKNGNSKLHSILSNLQAKQIQVLPLNDINCSDKNKSLTPEIESNTSTTSSEVMENSRLDVQEMIINESSDFRDFTLEADDIARDPLEVDASRTDSDNTHERLDTPKFIESTPQPKKRGRPRKLPVSEGGKPLILPKPALEERPQRSLRLSRDRPAIIAKPRGGRGRGRGRGRGAAAATPVVEKRPVEKTPPPIVDTPTSNTPDPLETIKQEEVLDPTSSRVKLPRMTEALDRLPGGSTPLSSRVELTPVATPVEASPAPGEGETATPSGGRRGRGRGGRTPRTPRGRGGRGRGGGRGAMYMKVRGGGRGATYMKETLGIYGRVCGPATTTVQLFEEETCMMDDNATPAKPTHLLDEDSQSSVKSSTNEESIKMKRSKFADLFDSNKEWTAADVKEYTWPPEDRPDEESQVMMIQEQVAMFLNVKGFKRRYPELKRRAIAGDERAFALEQGLVTEQLCDLGATAVEASSILDIMLSDFPHKYEEYRAHQRQRAAAQPPPPPAPAAPRPDPAKPEPKPDPEKTKQDLAAAAVASALEWNARLNALRRPACADLQSLALHTRRPPAPHPGPNNPAPPPPTHLRPPAGFYPHALLPGQYQHSYRRYDPHYLRYFPLNTATAAPPAAAPSSDSDGDSDRSRSSGGSDRPPKRKRLTKVKRHSQTESRERERDRDRDRDRDKDKERGEEEGEGETCRACRLRLEANRKYTHERFLVCAACNAKLHPSCTELSADTVRKCREYAWRCGECAACGACSRPPPPALAHCALCDRGYHPACLAAPPGPGRWHCAECAVCRSCGARSPAGDWHHQTRRGPQGHKVYSHSLCTPCARAYRIGRYCPLCERSFIGPKGTMQLVICKLCDRQLHQECVRQSVSTLNVLDYTCAECRRGGITSRAAAVRLAPRTIATLFMAKRRFNKYAHRQYMKSRMRQKGEAGEVGEVSEVSEPGEVGEVSETGEVGEINESSEVNEISEVSEPGEVNEISEPGESTEPCEVVDVPDGSDAD